MSEEQEPPVSHRIEVTYLGDADGERICDSCARQPTARKGCRAAVRLGFVYLELCSRCFSLLTRAIKRL